MKEIVSSCLRIERFLNWGDYIPIVSNLSGVTRGCLSTVRSGSGLFGALFFGPAGLVLKFSGKSALSAKYFDRAVFYLHRFGNGVCGGARAAVAQVPLLGNAACLVWDRTNQGAKLLPYLPKAVVRFPKLATHLVPR